MSDSLYAFLKGKWRVKRNVFDEKKKPQGIQLGKASYQPNGKNSLTFEEELEGLFNDHCGKAWHKQELSFDTPSNATLYQHGSIFHKLKFDKPFTLVHHTCKRDHYLGLYVFNRKRKSFTVTWRVKGPKKNYSLRAYYEKLN